MQGQRNHFYVGDSRYLGDAVLDGYGLFDTGYGYPAAVEMRDSRVYGEVYEVDEKTKTAMDILEGVGSLYDCITVTVRFKDHDEDVLFYVYLRDTSGMEPYRSSGKWEGFINTEESGIHYESETLYDEEHRFTGWIIKEISDNGDCHEIRFNSDGILLSEQWTEPWGGNTQPTLRFEYDQDGKLIRKTEWELQQEEGYGTCWNHVIYDGDGNIIDDTRW